MERMTWHSTPNPLRVPFCLLGWVFGRVESKRTTRAEIGRRKGGQFVSAFFLFRLLFNVLSDQVLSFSVL